MKNKQTWYSAAYNKATDKNEVLIYDQIGLYGVSASQFAVELRQMDSSKRLSVKINSPGGDVFDGIAIYNQLRDYKGGVDTIVDGLAASIASVIAMAGETITMYDTAMMMIHKPWTFTLGDSDQLRKDADLLDKIQEQIKIAYSNKTALTDSELDGIINAETWLSADEAEEYGFATNVIRQEKADKKKNSIKNKILNFGSYETFEKFNQIPSKIAACLVGKVKNNEQETAIEPEPVVEEPIIETPKEPEPEITPALETENNEPSQTNPLEKENKMTPEEIKAAVKAEKERSAEIRACGKKLNISNEEIENAIEKDLSVADASKLFIDKFTTALEPVPGVKVTTDVGDKFIELHSASLCHAAGLMKNPEDSKKGVEARKNGGAISLHGVMRSYLENKGIRIANLDGQDLIKKVNDELVATGTGDLPSVFENTINKALDTSMNAFAATFPIWTSNKPVKDFRQFSLAKISGVSNVKEIKENQNFEIGAISDKKEVGTLKTNGIFMSLSRQAQINDDLGALVDMGSMLGRSIMEGQERDCYDYLYGTGGAGPTMTEDSVSLFDVSTHGNYLTSGGAAPSSTTIDAGVLAMMTRPKLKANPADATEYTGIMPRFLLVPPKHKGAAERTVYSPTYPVATYPAGVYNAYAASGSTPLVVVTSAYLGSLDADGWYLLADPMSIPTIVRLTLNGNESPYIEQDIGRGKDPLGLSFRCYYDWAFMAGDWRGMYLNDGDA